MVQKCLNGGFNNTYYVYFKFDNSMQGRKSRDKTSPVIVTTSESLGRSCFPLFQLYVTDVNKEPMEKYLKGCFNNTLRAYSVL